MRGEERRGEDRSTAEGRRGRSRGTPTASRVECGRMEWRGGVEEWTCGPTALGGASVGRPMNGGGHWWPGGPRCGTVPSQFSALSQSSAKHNPLALPPLACPMPFITSHHTICCAWLLQACSPTTMMASAHSWTQCDAMSWSVVSSPCAALTHPIPRLSLSRVVDAQLFPDVVHHSRQLQRLLPSHLVALLPPL